MGYFQKYVNRAYVNHGFRIITPRGNIELIVREIGGTKSTRIGKIEVHGSPLVREGSLIELTKEPLKLASDISVKVVGSPTASSRLDISIVHPYYYIIKRT